MTRMLTTLSSLAFAALALPTLQAQIKVALCGAAGATGGCQWSTVQTTLLATGYFSAVDIIDVTTAGGGTPSLSTLLQYDALLCWTNTTPANNNTWGDVLADYVDAGGGVVVAVFANSSLTTGRNIGGRWQTGYEVVLDQSGSSSGAGGTLGTVHVPGHPSLAGVTTFTAGTIGSRPTGTALEVGSYLVAEWNNGKVLIAQGANPNRIDLGFYPPVATCSQSGWVTGGDLLMANSLLAVSTGATFGPYGTGCTGTLGVPTWTAQPGSRPVLGGVLLTDLNNLPTGIALLGLGTSKTSSGGAPLPFDLGLIGMTGCSLLADPAVLLTVAGVGPTQVWGLGIPNTGSLLGVELFGQGLPLDPGANPFGFTATNGGRIKVGV
ncbi:MAG: hypothetical protein JNN13_18955 [Planctomycetes bacterium]|nr:hypothetical protein [Planctomycetota bacterium]